VSITSKWGETYPITRKEKKERKDKKMRQVTGGPPITMDEGSVENKEASSPLSKREMSPSRRGGKCENCQQHEGCAPKRAREEQH